jgi:glycosyltransferase involved in cell wall biosynthesis
VPEVPISILIPVYNREKCIGECLRSASGQTLRNLDIVVSDNGSTDGTWSICLSMARQDPRIRLRRSDTNQGPVRNWKRCLDAARGQFGMLLFSDDALMPDFLERTAPFLDDPEVGFAFTAVKHGPDPARGSVLYEWGRRSGKISSREFLRDAMIHNGVLPCSPGATLFRIADLRRHLSTDIPSPSMNDFADHGAGPDLLLFLHIAARYPAIAHIAEPLAFFRDHQDSLSRERSGSLERAYAQARIWFGTEQSDPRWLNRAFGAYWMQQMKERCQWVEPRSLAGEFLMPGMRAPRYPSAFWHGVTGVGSPAIVRSLTVAVR